jgi:hypothetical protein
LEVVRLALKEKRDSEKQRRNWAFPVKGEERVKARK